MKNSKIIQILSLLIILLSLWFIGDKFWVHYNWIISSAFNFELITIIFICSIVYGLSEFLLSFAWRNLLILCGHNNISVNLCHKIYGKSQIAKYIPGNVFHILGRHVLANQAGINHMVLAGAAIYEILGLLSTSILISFSGMAIFGLKNIYFSFHQIIISLTVTIIISVLISFSAPYFMKLKGITLPYKRKWDYVLNISKIYFFYFLFFLIAGLLLVFIVKIFIEINFFISAKIIIIFSIAWLAGFIIPGAPGGIGVREVVIIFFISPIIGEAQSTVVAIALRFITLLGDLWFLIISNSRIKLRK